MTDDLDQAVVEVRAELVTAGHALAARLHQTHGEQLDRLKKELHAALEELRPLEVGAAGLEEKLAQLKRDEGALTAQLAALRPG